MKVPKRFAVPSYTLPNTTILTGIVVVLVVANIGVGSALMLSLSQRSQPVIMAPSPTPTPDPTRNWQSYTSQVYGFDAKVPEVWRIQEGVEGGDTMTYFHSNEAFGNTRYYISVSALDNPQKLSLSRRLLEEHGLEIPLAKEKIGKNIVYLATQVPSGLGAMSAYIPGKDESYYLTLSLTPFNTTSPYREQKRYESTFINLLSTITLSNVPPVVRVPNSSSSGSAEQAFWRTYNDRQYPYSFEYPPDSVLDTSRQGRVLLDKQIEFVVTSVNPTKCTGACPVREKESTVKVGGVSAKKYEGYFTSAGGQVPQRYLQYVVQKNSQYYMITLYELKVDDNGSANRTPRPIPLDDVQLLEQIIATFRFSK